jgi:DNA-binding PucR family transcriptional regulator
LLDGRLHALVEADRRAGPARGHHVETLRAFLDAFGDVVAASAVVGVHPNTFRYRMRRLVEVSGIDLDDPLERLVTHLQLHLSG